MLEIAGGILIAVVVLITVTRYWEAFTILLSALLLLTIGGGVLFLLWLKPEILGVVAAFSPFVAWYWYEEIKANG